MTRIYAGRKVYHRSRRKIAVMLDWPVGSERRYDDARKFYQWFRHKDNRFSAAGLHGFSGNVFFEAFDKGAADLPRDDYMASLKRDYNQHLRRRYQQIKYPKGTKR